jgi:hypothetical protein
MTLTLSSGSSAIFYVDGTAVNSDDQEAVTYTFDKVADYT